MQRISKLALCAVLATAAVASAARADGSSASTTTTTNTTTTTTNTTSPGSPAAGAASSAAPLGRFAWGTVGYYGVHYSACEDGFCVGGTDGSFGIQVGASMGLMDLMPGLHLGPWASVAPVFGSGTYFPINVGAGVAYDKLPVGLFAGLGFSIVPNSEQSVAVGLDINLMGVYPIPQVMKNLGVMAQLQFDILDENLTIWNFGIGATLGF